MPFGKKSLTLIELLVIISIAAALLGLVFVSVAFVQEQIRQVECINNLKEIGLALHLYFNEHTSYPITLGQLVKDKFLNDADKLMCPKTGYPYGSSYVMRNVNSLSETFVIGCPYHAKQKRSVNLFLDGSTKRFKMAFGEVGAQEITPGDILPVGHETNFPDGSWVNVQNGKVFLIQSFEIGDEKLYTLIAISGQAPQTQLEVNVNEGSKFEVITPAAITGVMGTKFTLTTSVVTGNLPKTEIELEEGEVIFEERAGKEKKALKTKKGGPKVKGEIVGTISVTGGTGQQTSPGQATTQQGQAPQQAQPLTQLSYNTWNGLRGYLQSRFGEDDWEEEGAEWVLEHKDGNYIRDDSVVIDLSGMNKGQRTAMQRQLRSKRTD